MKIKSEISSMNADQIFVRGYDLVNDLVGKRDIVDMFWLTILGRLPTEQEKRMSNALLVQSVSHGLTPHVIAARLTYLGAPDSFEGAVASGLLGLGRRYVGTISYINTMLSEKLTAMECTDPADTERVAQAIVDEYTAAKQPIPGLGHPLHGGGDPRADKIREIAQENGFEGPAVTTMLHIGRLMSEKKGKLLPVNGGGVTGAITVDMGLPPMVAGAFPLVAKTIGMVANLLEEQSTPIAQEIFMGVVEAAEGGAVFS